MAKQLLTVLKHFHGLHWLLPISLLLVSLSFISFTGDPSALKKQTRSIVVIGPPTSKLATHLYDADPIRFTLQTDKQNVRVNEEIAITITAHYLNIASSLLFTAEGSNAFRLKVLLPDGFVQTGGNYIDYVGAELSAVNPTISYTLKGHFIKHSSQSEFRLLRGIYQANANSLFVQKAQIVIQVTVNDAPVSLFQKARSGGCSYSEGQYLFTTGWGESAYAHYYNGVLFAAYQNGSSFKPRHWLVATGMMDANTANCFAEDDPHTVAVNPTPTPSGTCTYAEGQYLFTTSWGEVVYAHFYNGVLFAAFKDGSNFKPQHWLAATGMMTTTVATCFAENDPHTTSTPAPTTPTIPSTPTGNCGYSEGQYLFTFGTEPIYAHFYNSVLFAAYQNGSNFKPQHWLVATGLMTSSAANCFAENDPHTSTPTTPSITPSPSGNCGTGSGLTGFYSNSTDLSKNLAAVRTDGQINFTWNDSPIPGVVNADGFSIRWFGQIEAPTSGNYTFKTNNDDGTRLWVNGQQLIEDWNGHGPTWQQGSLYLNAGQKYNITIDYFDLWGGAQAQLYWEYPGQNLQLVPSCRLYSGSQNFAYNDPSASDRRVPVCSIDIGYVTYYTRCDTGEIIDYDDHTPSTIDHPTGTAGGQNGGIGYPGPKGGLGGVDPTIYYIPGGSSSPIIPILQPVGTRAPSVEETARNSFYSAMRAKGILFTYDEKAFLDFYPTIRKEVWDFINQYSFKPTLLASSSDEGLDPLNLYGGLDPYTGPDPRVCNDCPIISSPSSGTGVYGVPARYNYPDGTWGDLLYRIDKILFASSLFPGVGALRAPSAVFKAATFRNSLNALRAKPSAGLYDAHHILPQKFKDWFISRGINNIHDPRFGVWWDMHTHRQSARAYNLAWEEFINRNPNASTQEITNFARQLMSQYGFDIFWL